MIYICGTGLGWGEVMGTYNPYVKVADRGRSEMIYRFLYNIHTVPSFGTPTVVSFLLKSSISTPYFLIHI